MTSEPKYLDYRRYKIHLFKQMYLVELIYESTAGVG